MSYGYGVPYDHYSPIEFAQPHPEPNPMLFVHPDSVVAQLRLTLEEIREVLVDQVRWMREEYPKEEAAHLPTTAQHQWDNSTSLPPPPTTHIKPNCVLYKGYRTMDETPETVTSPDNDIGKGGDPTWSQPPSPVLDVQPLYQPPDHDQYSLMSNHSPWMTPFEYHEHKGGTSAKPNHDTMIKQLTCELFTSGSTSGNWAENMEMEIGLEPQGEYIAPNYSPTPVPPSPAPLHLPHAPTSLSVPCAPYRPPYSWYDPPCTCYMLQHPPFCPCPCLEHKWHPLMKTELIMWPWHNVNGFVQQHMSNTPGHPRIYPPPSIATGTPYRPQWHVPWSQDVCRDPPPHMDHVPRPSDLPDWHVPNLNHPTTSWSPSPPSQSPPTPP